MQKDDKITIFESFAKGDSQGKNFVTLEEYVSLHSDLQKANERIRQYQKEKSYLNTKIKNSEEKINRLSSDNVECAVLLIKVEQERDQLKADLAEAEKVIQFYADKNNYAWHPQFGRVLVPGSDCEMLVLNEGDNLKSATPGKRAREYLAKGKKNVVG